MRGIGRAVSFDDERSIEEEEEEMASEHILILAVEAQLFFDFRMRGRLNRKRRFYFPIC